MTDTSNKAVLDVTQKIGPHLVPSGVKDGMQQYKLMIPKRVYADIQRIAAREHTSASDLIRRAVKLAVFLADLELEPGAEFIIRRPGQPDQRYLFLA